jgi:hypothetical protein
MITLVIFVFFYLVDSIPEGIGNPIDGLPNSFMGFTYRALTVSVTVFDFVD